MYTCAGPRRLLWAFHWRGEVNEPNRQRVAPSLAEDTFDDALGHKLPSTRGNQTIDFLGGDLRHRRVGGNQLALTANHCVRSTLLPHHG